MINGLPYLPFKTQARLYRSICSAMYYDEKRGRYVIEGEDEIR
jgi:hypothetical protein